MFFSWNPRILIVSDPKTLFSWNLGEIMAPPAVGETFKFAAIDLPKKPDNDTDG
jgi:hypothetical protein